jgi:hypothetical protein
VLTLYSQGALTGLVVDSGDGVTHVVGGRGGRGAVGVPPFAAAPP